MKLFGLCKDPVKIYIGFLGPAPKIFFLHLEKHHLRECREETRPLVSHDVSKCEHSKHFLEDMLTLLRVRHRWLGGTLSLLSLPFKRWSSAKTACAYPRWPTSARLILQLLWRSWKEHTTEDFGLTISHISCIFMLWFWNIDFWWIWLPHIRDLFLQNFRTSTVVKILICDWRGWKEILVRLSHRWPTFRFSTTTSGFFSMRQQQSMKLFASGLKKFSMQPSLKNTCWMNLVDDERLPHRYQ